MWGLRMPKNGLKGTKKRLVLMSETWHMKILSETSLDINSDSSNIPESEYGTRPCTNQYSCTAGAKIFGIPLLGRLRHQAMNLVLQAGKDLETPPPKAWVPIFVPAPHQTGFDTRSMTRRSIKVGIRGEGDRARAEARALVTMMYLSHSKEAQPKLGALQPQVCLCWTRPASEPASDADESYQRGG